MRIPRIYVDLPLSVGTDISLKSDRAHYLLKVLRMEIGRHLRLFNGDGFDYLAILTATQKKSLDVHIEATEAQQSESLFRIHLAQVVSKGNRMDFTLQKAVELGVNEITPLTSSRSEVSFKGDRFDKKLEHWRNIIISACEQSGRAVVPTLNAIQSLNHLIKQAPKTTQRWILSPEIETHPLNQCPQSTSALLLIGPEGGFSEEEITQAQQRGFQGLTFGPRVLRTETAGLVAVSILQHRFGDL